MTLKDLQTQLCYVFKDETLLELALTHKSYSSSLNNERLEFLGDSILNSIISEYLFSRFTNQKEGLLTRMRAYLVKAETLTIKAEELSLEKLIKLSKGTANLSKERKNSILEGAFEAVIGAIFIDGGWNASKEITLKTFSKNLEALSEDMSFKDPKTELQELFQSNKIELPKYELEDLGNNNFSCTVNYDEMMFRSSGASKRIAETNVAMQLLAYINQKND
ncbi:ribonuclease III [Gammaproteobacteria bacterium]|jgi:ribonuclease-3|nr:ribonuclease III [Gammaproteobacteria bacterium]